MATNKVLDERSRVTTRPAFRDAVGAQTLNNSDLASDERYQGANGEKRLQIVDKATELFNRFGYEAVKVSDITDALHIGKGTLYLYFKTKKELLLECFRQLGSLVLTLEQRTQVRNAEGFFERIRPRFVGASEQYEKFAGVFNLIRMARVSDDSEINQCAAESYRPVIEPLKTDLEAAISQGTAKPVDAELAVYGLIGFADNVFYRATLDRRYTVEEANDVIVNFFESALRSRETVPVVGAESLSAMITDRDGICTEVGQICSQGELMFRGNLGQAEIEVDLRRIASMDIREAAPNWFADITMRDGRQASIQIDPAVQLSGQSPIGTVRITLNNVSKVVFEDDAV